jgi:hypothetical protein
MKQDVIQFSAVAPQRGLFAGGTVEIFPNEMRNAFAGFDLEVRDSGVASVMIHEFVVQLNVTENKAERNANTSFPIDQITLSLRP